MVVRVLRIFGFGTVACCVLVGLVAWTPLAAQALEGEGIAASPYSVAETLEAGGQLDGQLTITNPGSNEYDFQLSSEPFSVVGEDYRHVFVTEPGTVDASKWFSFPSTQYHLKPGQKLLVPYELKIPKGASTGGHYAVLFAETLTERHDGQGVSSRKRVGVIFYITVKGKLDKRGNVASFTSSFWQTKPPLKTELRMQNQGNTHYDTTVNVTISDLFGHTKAHLTSTRTILPKTIRRFAVNWDNAPSFGLFKVTGSAKVFGQDQPLPTRYVLLMSVPRLIVMATAGCILIALLLLSRARSRRHKR